MLPSCVLSRLVIGKGAGAERRSHFGEAEIKVVHGYGKDVVVEPNVLSSKSRGATRASVLR